MRRITYSGDSFLTSDEIGVVLLDLAAALGQTQQSEAVEIPALDADGGPILLQLLIGPASEFISTPEESEHPEPKEPGRVTQLRDRAAELRAVDAIPVATPSSAAMPNIDAFGNPG